MRGKGHSTQHLRSVRKVLVALEQLEREQPGTRPTIRDLMELTNMPSGSVHAALKTLRDNYGYVEQGQENGRCVERTIRLVEQTY